MPPTLQSVRTQVEYNLMDTTHLIWSATILDEAIRASLADLSIARGEILYLKDLDSAQATTVDALDVYLLVKGAAAHALIFRVVGRFEEATPEPNLTPAFALFAEKNMKAFKTELSGALASGNPALEVELAKQTNRANLRAAEDARLKEMQESNDEPYSAWVEREENKF